MPRKPQAQSPIQNEGVAFWSLVFFLVLAFLTGGGARADVQSLVVLRPAAVVFCGIGVWGLKREQLQAHRFLFGMAAAIFALVLLHLIPLPYQLWKIFPGRELATTIDNAVGLGHVWRPISMVPPASWNAFYSLFVPLAVLLLGVQLTREQRIKLLPVLLLLGLSSGVLGLVQAIGDPYSGLYLYRITNNGSAVGLFSNRNHQAILLAMLFPMLAVYAFANIRTEDQATMRGWVAVAAAIVLVPLLLVTGSRGGLVMGVIGIGMAASLYRKPQVDVAKKRKVQRMDWRYPLAGLSVLFLGVLTTLMSRAEALQRLSASDPANDQRLQVWGPIAGMAWKYFPLGSGIGSFVEAYQIDEPRELLGPNYLNHAHNDWLEVVMTAGFAGLFLLALATAAFARGIFCAYGKSVGRGRGSAFARLGGLMIAIFALGSIVDYPLRTPSLDCVFVIALLWFSHVPDSQAKTAGDD